MYAFITDKGNNRLFQKGREPQGNVLEIIFYIPNDHSTDVIPGRSPCMMAKLGCANHPKSYVGVVGRLQ